MCIAGLLHLRRRLLTTAGRPWADAGPQNGNGPWGTTDWLTLLLRIASGPLGTTGRLHRQLRCTTDWLNRLLRIDRGLLGTTGRLRRQLRLLNRLLRLGSGLLGTTGV